MQKLTDRQITLAQAVQAHASQNYNTGGWDILVECYTLEGVAELIGKARTAKGAIKKAAQTLGVIAGVREDRQAEADYQIEQAIGPVQPEPTKPEGYRIEGIARSDCRSGNTTITYPGFVGRTYIDEDGEVYYPGWSGQHLISAGYCNADSAPF